MEQSQLLRGVLMELLPQSEYISLTMEFRCNLKCVHCMIEGTMDDLQPQTQEQFQEVLAVQHSERRWRGIILTGSEITLLSTLPELAAQARHAGFERVRIQTHGMKLANPNYLERIITAGVNEFFISIPGCDSATNDAITQVPGSWQKAYQGLQNLDGYAEVIAITNSVITRKSYPLLPHIVENLANIRSLKQMEFWFYWPMTESDERDLVPRFSDAQPHLLQAIAAAEALQRRVEVKNFPQCLLDDYGDRLLNDQPLLLIDDAFWLQFERNGFYQCGYRQQCQSEQCLGLNSAYIERYGDELELLKPIKLT